MARYDRYVMNENSTTENSAATNVDGDATDGGTTKAAAEDSSTAKRQISKWRWVVITLAIPVAIVIVGTVAVWWRPMSISMLCPILISMGHSAMAEPLARRAVELFEKEYGPNNRNTMWAAWNLAEAMRDQKKFKQSEALYLRILAYNARNPKDSVRPPEVIRSYAALLRETGRTKEADQIEAQGHQLGTK